MQICFFLILISSFFYFFLNTVNNYRYFKLKSHKRLIILLRIINKNVINNFILTENIFSMTESPIITFSLIRWKTHYIGELFYLIYTINEYIIYSNSLEIVYLVSVINLDNREVLEHAAKGMIRI